MLRFIANVLWLLLSGLWMAIGFIVSGIVMCILIITIPFGIASFRMAGYALWPFGRTVVARADAGAASAVGNVIWFILAGIWLAIGYVLSGLVFFITIIGIPFGIASFKLAGLALTPLGKDIVPIDYVPAAGERAIVTVTAPGAPRA